MTTTAPRGEDHEQVGADLAALQRRLDAAVGELERAAGELRGGDPASAEVEVLRAELDVLRGERDLLRARLQQLAPGAQAAAAAQPLTTDPYPDAETHRSDAPPLVPIRPPVVVLPAAKEPAPPIDPAVVHPALPPHPRPRRSAPKASRPAGRAARASGAEAGAKPHRHLSAGPVATVVVWLLVLIVAIFLLR